MTGAASAQRNATQFVSLAIACTIEPDCRIKATSADASLFQLMLYIVPFISLATKGEGMGYFETSTT
eukprot:6906729-Pyramimonas_sp.AAC.1